MMELYYDRQGNTIDMHQWASLNADLTYKRVAAHWIRGYMVSTVRLGLNRNFIGDGAPIIFETMAFPPGDEAGEYGIWSEEFCERYATEAAALAGHDRALAMVRDKLGADTTDVLTEEQFRSQDL